MTPESIAKNFLYTVGCLFGYVVYLLLIIFPSVILGLILTYTVKTGFRARVTMDYFPLDEIFQTGVAYFLFIGLVYFLFACWYLLGIPIQTDILTTLWGMDVDVFSSSSIRDLLPQACVLLENSENPVSSSSMQYLMVFVFFLFIVFSRFFIIFAPAVVLFYIGSRCYGGARMRIKDEGIGFIPAYLSASFSLFFAWVLVAVLVMTLGHVFRFNYWDLVIWLLNEGLQSFR